ncbi:SH2 domain-containing protein 4A [Alosa sapidissima]|uniref:SH2 domain-containing protein 4A n=1 Tax=Alosa sapidissima TaxID=34773 RepID=UPI001C0885AB|nr:SH2 domain-containing protein 4A [Alosa sapidissima]XP_041917977.1 SH2 domain-containing protein 4A [Alosa sapidissima]XP_041917978.1 SH2 domain-containing protein 4A [Alosa sapidissima]XP_041917979.1 SH2 domain-containing protein 4A [Alosa sapidissima]XP_041917980.1 SH2 domain-containing protein 4A [Alosa sapidissima]XP_041917981.1 SH2 domain-containing protein 4A [Alosa sapidissima]
MLQQILKDMYVDPDVLEALGDEQKKTLFLKMREEQVRRWTEREEKEAKEDRKENRAKQGNRKSVTWLLGRDGDVHVRVIGDTDTERSPKHLLAELRQNGSIRMKHNSEPLKNNQVDQNDIQLDLKKPEKLCESGSTAPVPEDPRQASGSPSLANCMQDSKDDSDDSGTVEDDLKDPSEEEENSGSASDDLSDSGVFFKSHCRDPGLSIITRKPHPQDTQPSVKERLSVKEKPVPQESQGGDKDVSKDTPSSSLHGNRVAQLRRNFGVAGSNSVPTGVKPPVPTKPAHLQRQSVTMSR